MIAALVASLLLAPQSTVSVEDRTEARGRVSARGEPALDLETQPTVRLRLRARHDEDDVSLAYGPRLILTRPEGQSVQGQVLHTGSFRAAVARRRFWFGATQLLAYGTVGVGALLVQPRWETGDLPPSPLPLPLDGALAFTLLSSQSTLGVGYALAPRVAVGVSASYFVYGGPDAESRKQLAQTSGPAAEARVDVHVTRRDDAAVAAGARYQRLLFAEGEGPSTAQGYLEGRFRHRLTRLSRVEGGAGATAQGTDGTPARLYASGDLAAVFGFQQRSAHAELALVGRAGPWLNIFTGAVAERLEGVVAASWTFGRSSLFAAAAVQATLPAPDGSGYRLWLASAGYGRALTRTLRFDVGARAGVQQVTGPALDAAVVQVSAYAALEYTPLAWRLP